MSREQALESIRATLTDHSSLPNHPHNVQVTFHLNSAEHQVSRMARAQHAALDRVNRLHGKIEARDRRLLELEQMLLDERNRGQVWLARLLEAEKEVARMTAKSEGLEKRVKHLLEISSQPMLRDGTSSEPSMLAEQSHEGELLMPRSSGPADHISSESMVWSGPPVPAGEEE